MENPSEDLGRTFCDLVMKGGITSGVAYPTAVAGLAERYRLRNIGGASAGAIAAGAAAAAEYRRQRYGSRAGFERLATLPNELGNPSPEEPKGPSLLFRLFAPTTLSKPLFRVLTDSLNQKTWGARIALVIRALVREFPWTVVVGTACLAAAIVALGVVLVPGFRVLVAGSSPLVPVLVSAIGTAAVGVALLLTSFLTVLVLTAIRALRYFGRVMSEQNFGLCTGMNVPSAAVPALTEWLHGLIQEIAGEPTTRPLTFGDLRRLRFDETPGVDGVVLRLMTTCLTLGRPFTLPIQDRLYFSPTELARYFPAEVVEWMKNHSWRHRNTRDRSADELARPLLPIPEPDDFPILVGVRMSLSFPILLSAIPLHRYSVRKQDDSWFPYLQPLVFSDGGICSNLPVHLFDSSLPPWPTFALNLKDDLPIGSPDAARIVVPNRGRNYVGDQYDIASDGSLAATASFLGAIVQTMQNWRDMLQRAAPGTRERVFTIRHTKDEGGLNLDMPPEAIDAMARSGAQVASAIQKAFLAPPSTPPCDDDWEYHRWVRLRLLLPTLRGFVRGIRIGTSTSSAQPSV
jgi:predicted acylesterase/phospholipase RssA